MSAYGYDSDPPSRSPAMDEALAVEVLAVHDVGRQLHAESASAAEWRRYRAWRDAVIADADDHATDAVAV